MSNEKSGESLLQSPVLKQLDNSIYWFITPVLLKVKEEVQSIMIDLIETSELIQTISVVGLSLLVVLIYLVVWMRWINRINVKVNRTVKMLNMIPP